MLKQRGFPGVGVAHKPHRHRTASHPLPTVLSLSVGVFFLTAPQVGQFAVQVGNDVLKGGHTATAVPSTLAGRLLLSQFPEDGAVGLKLGDTNLGSGFHRGGVGREQGEEEPYSVPNLDAKRLAHTHELSWGGVGVDDRQIHALPRVAGKRALTLVCNVLKPAFPEIGAWVNVARLQHRFNDGDAHRFSQGSQFSGVLGAPDQKERLATFVVGSGLTQHHTTAARYDERVIGRLRHALSERLVSYQPTSRRHHDRRARDGSAMVRQQGTGSSHG